MLQQIFNRQRELMAKYHDIESNNSGIFLYQDPRVPVDINSLKGQARIKHLAWYTVEEVAEALDGQSPQDQKQELADALHFLVEVFIVSGYDADFVEDLDLTFKRFKALHLEISLSGAVTHFIQALGNAMNKLKNKPWKLTHTPVDLPTYEAWLTLSMFHFIQIAWALGIRSGQEMLDLYMGKAEINKHRQESGY